MNCGLAKIRCKSTFYFRLSVLQNKCQCWVHLLGSLTNKVTCESGMNTEMKMSIIYNSRKEHAHPIHI